MTKRLNVWLLSLLLLIAIPYYWFLLDSGAGPDGGQVDAKPLSIAQLRELAGSGDGQHPVELRVETVGTRSTPRNMLIAGEGLRDVPNVVRAYELLVPGSGPIVIDAGTSAKAAEEADFATFDAAAQARVNRALAKASHSVILADRQTHNGGFPAGTRRAAGAVPPAGGEAPYRLAPGVVVIPASGMPAGTNMVYAHFADDREYLFTGDVARLTESWYKTRLPARLATRGEIRPYRAENLAWLRTIKALHSAAPQMTIVSGHELRPIAFSAGSFSD